MDTNILLLVALLVLGFLGFRFLTKENKNSSTPPNAPSKTTNMAKPTNMEDAKKKQMDELFRLPQAAKGQEEANLQKEKLAQLQYRSPENSVNGAIEKIKEIEPKFNIKDFIKGAQGAFTEITQAFAKGDREFIRHRTNENVFHSFDSAIAARMQNHQSLDISYLLPLSIYFSTPQSISLLSTIYLFPFFINLLWS